MRSVVIDNRQFQLTVERRTAYRLPFHAEMIVRAAVGALT
jgi:hypothetical protein